MANQPYSSRGGSSQRPQQQRTEQHTQQQARPDQRTSNSMPPPAGAGNQAPAVFVPGKQKLFEKFGAKFGIDPDLLVETLKKTCFRGQRADSPAVTNEQLVALLIVADQYGLNPFTKEIYAYPDKNGGIVPVVSVDGWIRIIQEHEHYNGMEIRVPDEMIEDTSERKHRHKRCWEWMEVTIFRKDRDHQTPVVEYFDEVYRQSLNLKSQDGSWYEVATPWQSHTKRMMRHKTIIQSGRVTFGFAGIYDDDEAQRILDDERIVSTVPAGQAAKTHTDAAREALRKRQGAPAQRSATPDPAAKAQSQDRQETPRAPADGEGNPWDDETPHPANQEARAPKTKDDWIRAIQETLTSEACKAVWHAYVDAADQAGLSEPDLDIEATYQLHFEQLTGK